MPLDYNEKYDVIGSAGASLTGGVKNFTLATGVDVVTTMLNSLSFTGLYEDFKTEDILQRIDEDALGFFQENPDAVKTTSLIGGALIPGVTAVKLLDRARRGVTSLGYGEGFVGGVFTGYKQKALVKEIQDIFKTSGAATAEYKNTVRQLYAANIGKEFIDNAIIEAAVVGAFNAHPYLDDYWKDPVANFALGTTIGGVLGGAVGFASTRKLIMNSTGDIALGSLNKVLDSGYKNVDDSFSNSARFQMHTANVKNLDELISDNAQLPITREIASSFRVQEAAAREEALMKAAPWLKAGKFISEKDLPAVKESIIQLLSNPNFIGVDSIRFYDLDKSVKETAKLIEIEGTAGAKNALDALVKGLTGTDFKEQISKTFVTPEGKPAIAFVRLSTGEVFGAKGVRNAALAVDIKDIKTIIKSKEKEQISLFKMKSDFAEDNLFRNKSSAHVDAEFLKELVVAAKELKEPNFPYLAVAPDDLPRQNAIAGMLAKMSPEDIAKFQIKITTDIPTFQQQQEYIKNVVEKTVVKDYDKRLNALSERVDIGLYRNVSREAKEILEMWQNDENKGMVRRAFDAFFHGSELHHSESHNVRIAEEIWASGELYRQELRKIADSEDYVYLYRAVHGPIKGHAPVEGYSTKPLFRFGTPRLFRVHVDNVIGTINSPFFTSEREILVGAPHQQIVDSLPIETKAAQMVHIPNAGYEQAYTADTFLHFHALATERQIKDMIANKNFSFEEISARTNTTVDAVRVVAFGGQLENIPGEWRRYTDAAKVDDYLAPKNKLYALVGNPNKNPLAESMANLDYRQQRIAHAEIVEQMTAISGSDIANTVLDIYRKREMQLMLDDMLNKIGTINNQLVGDPRFQSADNALRQLKIGPTLTALGKEITDQVDRMKQRFLEPMANAMLPLKEKPAALAEFNRVVNKLASMKGWRDIVLDETTGKYVIVEKSVVGKQTTLNHVKDADGTEFFISQREAIDALESTRRLSGELMKMHNLNRQLTGQAPLNDLGFYLPPISLVNRSFAFVVDNTGKENVQLLVASSADELGSLIQAYKGANASKMSTHTVFTKGEQAFENLARGYTDYQAYTTYANVAYQHKGSSALAVVPSDFRMVENMLQGYENLILQGSRKYAEIYLNDITGWLDHLSAYYQRLVSDQPRRGLFKETTKDAALTVKNILLGRDQLEQSAGLKSINSLTDFLLNRAGLVVNNVSKTFTGEKLASKEYFQQLEKDLKAAGVPNIWNSFDEYLATTRADFKNLAPSVISAGNGLMATLMLRVFEVAQASINIMSLPILTWSALMERLPSTPVGPDSAIKFPLRIMMDGIRHMNSPMGLKIEKELWEPKGLIDQTVRQYTELTGNLKAPTEGKEGMDKLINLANGLQNNKLVKDYLAKPADWAEKFTRRFAMHVGYQAAKHAYPGIDDTAATIAAINFTDRSIGNYHAAQRPTAFQGTFGAAIGLFQTYFLTFAQNMYRGMEERNFKQLASLMLTQSGIFGMSSWPGFSLLSEQIVSRFNDKHYDLTTGTYRAVGDPAAEIILYGLPSSLGPAFYTRGDISPRIPSTMTEVAVFNGLKEGWNAAYQVVSKTAQGVGDGTPIQSLFEALSLQSLNRPVARWSELVTGASVTRQGNTVSPASEVWTPTGVFARLLATRPIEEQVVRNARHLNQFYKELDFERRQDVMEKIKIGLRDGKLDDQMLSEAALDYVRFGGDARGWRAALNNAMLKAEEGTRLDMLRKLEPDSPLHHMLGDMY